MAVNKIDISPLELHIHRLKKEDGMSAIRSIQTLELELAEIMKVPDRLRRTGAYQVGIV